MPIANFPYVDVENLADAVVLALDPPLVREPVDNVIDGDGDARDYVAAVGRAIGRDPPPVSGDAPRVTYAGARIRQELGYTPKDRWREFLEALARAG